MDNELFVQLEQRIDQLLEKHRTLLLENKLLQEENNKLVATRDVFKSRLDQLLQKLEGL